MATPTTYNLNYDTPCDVEGGCGDVPCGGKPEFIPRPQIFCKEATVQGDLFVAPNQIFVGGARYAPRIVVGRNGSFTCLVRV
jgi:hypothetical protein